MSVSPCPGKCFAQCSICSSARVAAKGTAAAIKDLKSTTFRSLISRRHEIHSAIAVDIRYCDGHGCIAVHGSCAETMARSSLTAYRELITRPDFWDFYTSATPIKHLSRLPIASRPVMRGSTEEVGFEDLRAIPWVMGWIQTRFNVPGWFGLGTAISSLLNSLDSGYTLDSLRRLYSSSVFFKLLIDNAEQEMARSRLRISCLYGNSECTQVILDEFQKTKELLLALTGQQELLDNRRVIKTLIRARNPHTDVLNLMQIEALRRYEAAAAEHVREAALSVILRSMNGIAAAMQSTG